MDYQYGKRKLGCSRRRVMMGDRLREKHNRRSLRESFWQQKQCRQAFAKWQKRMRKRGRMFLSTHRFFS